MLNSKLSQNIIVGTSKYRVSVCYESDLDGFELEETMKDSIQSFLELKEEALDEPIIDCGIDSFLKSRQNSRNLASIPKNNTN